MKFMVVVMMISVWFVWVGTNNNTQARLSALRTNLEQNQQQKRGVNDCKRSITAHMKAPSTTEFLRTSNPKEMNDGKWVWYASVDAQNAFGVPLRSYWECVYNQEFILISVKQLD